MARVQTKVWQSGGLWYASSKTKPPVEVFADTRQQAIAKLEDVLEELRDLEYL